MFWSGKWHPALIVRTVKKKKSEGRKLEVEFTGADWLNEIVPESKTRRPAISPVKTVAGSFNWQLFKAFFDDIIRDKAFIKPLSGQELADLDLKPALFSAHAIERRDERYHENMQELLRSLNSRQFLAARETRRTVYCGDLQLNCTPDLKHIYSVQRKSSTRGEKILETNNFKNAVKNWNEIHCSDVVIDLESSELTSRLVTRVQVITTTTKFVLSEDYSRVVTVVKLEIGFRQWQALQRGKHRRRVNRAQQFANERFMKEQKEQIKLRCKR